MTKLIDNLIVQKYKLNFTEFLILIKNVTKRPIKRCVYTPKPMFIFIHKKYYQILPLMMSFVFKINSLFIALN